MQNWLRKTEDLINKILYFGMADRACRNFQPKIFNKNKCQNCYKLQDAHRGSQSTVDPFPRPETVESVSTAPSTKPTTIHTKVALQHCLLSVLFSYLYQPHFPSLTAFAVVLNPFYIILI